MRWHVMKKINGFTLIELIVTIAVFGVIVALATPSFLTTIQRTQLNSDSRDFVDVLNEQRSEAILKQRNIILAFNTSVVGANKVWISSSNTKWFGGSPTVNSLTFTMMGRLDGGGQCFILQHVSNINLKAVIIIRKSGMIIYNKATSVCPADLGVE